MIPFFGHAVKPFSLPEENTKKSSDRNKHENHTGLVLFGSTNMNGCPRLYREESAVPAQK
jgi:hypothetical protein